MAGKSPYETIFKTRHAELKAKDDNWKLVYNAYLGGTYFSEGGYLIKYPKESRLSFDTRKKRAVYFNQESPIVDMLSGLLYMNLPTREIPKDLSYIKSEVSKGKNLDEFMRAVAAHSLMFTCGVLVDGPIFNPEEVKTKKDAAERNLKPLASLYLPFRIRDFNINASDGELDWVLLDNSYTDHTDPLSNSKEITKYTLWTRNDFQNFTKEGLQGIPMAEAPVTHGLGMVPFRFVSWRDDNNDFISESICEDIAMISKLIYNNMSYMDEMLAAGTFKMLTYPSKDGSVPEQLTAGGVGALSIIPYDMASSTIPSFIGHSLTDIEPFIKAITFYMAEVLKKVGLSTDETKEFVKSGAAKKIDFQKMRALLQSGALVMGKTEEWICHTAAKWQGLPEQSVKVDYTSSFSNEDLQTEVTMLTELLVHPIKKLNDEVLKLIVKKLLGNYLEPEVIQDINKEIESTKNLVDASKNSSKVDLQKEALKIKNASQGA